MNVALDLFVAEQRWVESLVPSGWNTCGFSCGFAESLRLNNNVYRSATRTTDTDLHHELVSNVLPLPCAVLCSRNKRCRFLGGCLPWEREPADVARCAVPLRRERTGYHRAEQMPTACQVPFLLGDCALPPEQRLIYCGLHNVSGMKPFNALNSRMPACWSKLKVTGTQTLDSA